MLTKEQKKQVVDVLAEDFGKAKSIVFSSFSGLSTSDTQELRAKLREQSVSYKVVKITLLKMALQRAGVDVSRFETTLPTAVSWSDTDEVAPAKVLSQFAKDHETLQVLSGVLDKQFMDENQIKQLASLPGKDELRGQLVSVIAGPLRGLVGVLSGNLRQFVYVLNAIKEAKS